MAASAASSAQVARDKYDADRFICRAWLLGRCSRGDDCPMKHGSRHETSGIICCSGRKRGDTGFRPNYNTCQFTLATCPYKHHVDKAR